MRTVKIYQTQHIDFRFMDYEYFIKQAGFVDTDSFNLISTLISPLKT